MSSNIITFELNEGMKTSDNFYVSMKGFVEINQEVEKDDLLTAVNRSTQSYLEKITLLEALDLVDTQKSEELIEGLEEYGSKVSRIEISTVDAVEGSDFGDVDVDIDPSLEGQKKSKGLIGKIKGLFKR